MESQTKTNWRNVTTLEMLEKLPAGHCYSQEEVSPKGNVPVVDQGKEGIIGYHDNMPDVVASHIDPVITFANHTCRVEWRPYSFSVIQNVFPMRAKIGFDLRYVYYRVKDVVKLEEYKGHWPIFEKQEFLVPGDLSEQKRIAGILSAFDDKIENNNHIIKTLEETAQMIFKEWFADFRFPGYENAEFVDSELGHIPKGWEVKNVLEIVKRISVGKKYENKTALLKGKVPILDQGHSGCIGYHNDEPGVVASIENPVVVFTNHTCNYRLVTYPFSAIQNVLPYIGNNGYPTLFIYYLTRGRITMQEYKGHWPEFEQQEFLVPPPELAENFAEFLKPMTQKIVGLENENQKLATMRDLLLPKLMSGEIRV